MEGLIRKGARATLRMQSFVTGVLYIAIDYFPDTPVRLLGLDKTLPELPTIPSEMDQLKSNIEQAMADFRKLPLDAILTEALGGAQTRRHPAGYAGTQAGARGVA